MKNNAFRILVTFFPLAIGLILLVIYAITFNKHLLYAIGFCTGLSAVFLLATILSFIMKKKFLMKKEFDERQLKNRGDCFSISFFVLITCLFLDGLVRYILEYDWSNYLVGIAFWILLSIGVFAILAIWKDAYTNVGANKIHFGIYLIGISLLDLALGVINGIRMGFLENGQIGTCFINLFSGLIIFIIALNLFLKAARDRKDDFVNEELKTEIC